MKRQPITALLILILHVANAHGQPSEDTAAAAEPAAPEPAPEPTPAPAPEPLRQTPPATGICGVLMAQGERLIGATVVVRREGVVETLAAITDENGEYCFAMGPGNATLQVFYDDVTLLVEGLVVKDQQVLRVDRTLHWRSLQRAISSGCSIGFDRPAGVKLVTNSAASLRLVRGAQLPHGTRWNSVALLDLSAYSYVKQHVAAAVQVTLLGKTSADVTPFPVQAVRGQLYVGNVERLLGMAFVEGGATYEGQQLWLAGALSGLRQWPLGERIVAYSRAGVGGLAVPAADAAVIEATASVALVRAVGTQNKLWALATASVPVWHDTMASPGAAPMRRLDLSTGIERALTNKWSGLVRIALTDGGLPDGAAAALPVLDRGYDQLSVSAGLVRQFGNGMPGYYGDATYARMWLP